MNVSRVGVQMFPAMALLAACSSTPLDPPLQRDSGAPAAPYTREAPAAPASALPAPSTVATAPLPPHRDPSHPLLTRRSVFFEYDDFSVRPPYRNVVDMHANHLRSNPELAIRIEGHSDERGSAEYNLALGQRRAESVFRALRIHGIDASRMEPVSYGEERALADGHDEAAWARNRRADIAYRD